MSMLSNQADELREMANKLGFNGVSTGDIAKLVPMLREAADTITSLWNSLTVSEAALNKAAGNWAKADSQIRENGGRESNYEKLFGTPERAARTLFEMCRDSNGGSCAGCPILGSDVDDCSDTNALLEWLRGDA